MNYRKQLESAGSIFIRPFVNPKVDNMGLQKYEMVVFPGTKHSPTIAAVEQNGKLHYLNGLNEFSADVMKIKDQAEKQAKIKEIREIVAALELEKNLKRIDVEDPDFWSKVETYRPDNSLIWTSADLVKPLGNDPIRLDPLNNINDLLYIRIIEAGGIPEIAKSKEDAMSSHRGVKWYLDRQAITAVTNTSVNRVKNKALALLTELFEDSPGKLLYIAKVLNPNSTQYKNNTPTESLYEYLDNYINGLSVESSIKQAVTKFTELAEMNMQDLKIKAIVKDAMVFRYLQIGADQNLYTHSDRTMVGKNMAEAYLFLKNPVNEDVLVKLMDEVEQNW